MTPPSKRYPSLAAMMRARGNRYLALGEGVRLVEGVETAYRLVALISALLVLAAMWWVNVLTVGTLVVWGVVSFFAGWIFAARMTAKFSRGLLALIDELYPEEER